VCFSFAFLKDGECYREISPTMSPRPLAVYSVRIQMLRVLWKSAKGELTLDKQICKVSYWIGLLCTVIAIITRGLTMIGVMAGPLAGGTGGALGRIPLSYKSFLDGAMLFFLMSIASAVGMWAKDRP
jgi:hypothetical protein